MLLTDPRLKVLRRQLAEMAIYYLAAPGCGAVEVHRNLKDVQSTTNGTYSSSSVVVLRTVVLPWKSLGEWII